MGKLRGSLALALACWLGLASGVLADEAGGAHRFEQAQRDEPSLLAFLQTFPKGGDLHNHLNGALYSETLVDWAIAHDLYFDPKTSMFSRTDAPGRVPARELQSDDALLGAFSKAASMSGAPLTQAGHDHFFAAFDFITSVAREMPLEDRITPVAKEALAENLHYMELMATPASSALRELRPTGYDSNDLEGSLHGMEPAIASYVKRAHADLDRVDTVVAKRLNYAGHASDPGSPITLRYIFQVDRNAPDAAFFMSAAAGLSLMKAAPQMVGINIVSPEDAPVSRTHFNTQMHLLDFLWHHFGKPNMALHAGELTPQISPLEPMQSHIRQSIELGHARRIGHGVAVAWDRNAAGLLAEMKRNHVAVEICLSSNDTILGVRGSAHPVGMYMRAGVPVTIATDDEGVSRSDMTLEYAKFIRTASPSYTQLKDVSRNGLEYAFLEGGSLYVDHDMRHLRAGFETVRDAHWSPTPAESKALAASPKLRLEVRLERAFVAFEE